MNDQKPGGLEYKPEISWIESSDGSFLPTKNYNSALTEDDGEALANIEWKKVSFAKKGTTKSNLEKSLKPGDIVYHTEYGHVLLEKALGEDETLKTKWECKILSKKA